MRPVVLGLARRLVAAALVTWPASSRRRDGRALREVVDAELADAARRGTRALVGCALAEAAAVARAGIRMRTTHVAAPYPGHAAGVATGWWEDARLAARALRRAPTFTLLTIATLALGVGANAAVYDLVDRVLLRPPPYDRPDGLVLLWSTLGTSSVPVPMPAPDAAAVREGAPSLAALAFVSRSTDATLGTDRDSAPRHVVMAGVSPELFDVLGVAPARGGGFGAVDPGVVTVMISDAVWRRVFGADPAVIGATVLLNALPATLLGVAPPGFHLEFPPAAGLGPEAEVWVAFRAPLEAFERPDGRLVDRDSDNTGAVIGRLADGASLERAREDAARIARGLRRDVPSYDAAGYELEARPLHADATAHARPLLLLLLAGGGGVLLVACLSVAALLLARGMARERELAVRIALGAERWRVTRLLIAESTLLALLGGVAGLAAAGASGGALTRLVPPRLAAFASGGAGTPVGIVLACTAAVGVLLASMAFWQTRGVGGAGAPLLGALRARFHRARAREVLVVTEVAISVVLVLGTGLLLRTGRELVRVDAGFRPDSALVFDVSLRVADRYGGPAERAQLVQDLERAVLDVPGVHAVGLTGGLPLSGRRWTRPWGFPGESTETWTSRWADFRMVTSGYFAAIGTPLVEGRTFTADEDLDERQRVVIVDETLARRLAPGGSALGREIGIPVDGAAVRARIVGVVSAVRHDALDEPAHEAIYVPYRQEASRDVSFVVRTDGDPAHPAAAVRAALVGVEPRLAVYGMRPMTAYIDSEVAPARFGLTLLGVYAGLGLLAAAMGLYGVVAWEVGRRTHELGVRMAIGATTARIRGSVLMRGLKLGGLGAALGVALAALAAGGLRRIVYGVGVADPATWIGVAVVIGGVTLVACWLPARRAAGLDPAEALRAE